MHPLRCVLSLHLLALATRLRKLDPGLCCPKHAEETDIAAGLYLGKCILIGLPHLHPRNTTFHHANILATIDVINSISLYMCKQKSIKNGSDPSLFIGIK